MFRIHLPLFGLLVTMISACNHAENKTGESETLQRFIDDVTFIAKMPRTPDMEHHKAVQDLCAKRFKELGFEVELHDYGTGTNVIGVSVGKLYPEEKILLSAHYDTVLNCNGADDNASGIVGVFETARLLASKQHDRTLVVACWDEEERKTAGSKAYVARERNNSDIKMSYVYEMIGYKRDEPNSQKIPKGFEQLYPQQVNDVRSNQNRGDFIALVYDDTASEMLSTLTTDTDKQRLSVLQFKVSSQLKSSVLAADLRRSDHSAFWDADFPAAMVTDTANFRNPHYHCLNGEDKVESLNAGFAIETVNMMSKIIAENLSKK